VWLGDSYLELIGVFDAARASQSWLGRAVIASIERGGGLVTWAVAVDDIDAALRWGPREGGLIGPFPGGRQRPDDAVVRWRIARRDAPSRTEPFAIEHDRTAAEWTGPERAARAGERHPLGGRVRLVALELVAPSPAVAAGGLRRLLGVNAEPAGRRAVRVPLGAQEVRFVLERSGAPALVELITDIALRTRTARLGDCDLRLRGMPVPAGAPGGGETSPEADVDTDAGESASV
jgi:Glyoxalase-like domain